jgi:acyl-CoA synthetase (AMP-forming)/AMP-acid ligase II
VADIPLDENHRSFGALDGVASGMSKLADVPALLLWGTRDPVFSEQYLHDLEERLPHADVHRFVAASHFVTEDAPVAEAFWEWVSAEDRPPRPALTSDSPLRPTDLAASPLVVERHGDRWRSIDSEAFAERTGRVARGLARAGVKPGDRVATMIPPGIDLTVVLYACWQAGFTAVLVDGGLGVGNMHRAIKAAAPQWLVGISPAVAAAKALRWKGTKIVAGEMDSRLRAALGVAHSLREIELMGEAAGGAPNGNEHPAVIGFTSGSTGPSKGVQYRSEQLAAQRDAISALYRIDSGDRLVAAFAPFALYGPALGIASIVPEMDVTRPATLTASALGAAAAEIDATIIFASPAALQNVVATAQSMSASERAAVAEVRLVMSAGAPLRLDLLQAVAEITPHADVHAPYGMTEVLPVADLSLVDRMARGRGEGSCVGRPIQGVAVRIHPLDFLGRPAVETASETNVLGEVVVSAPHLKERYDRLWWTEHRSLTADGWHRTGDIGRLDDDGFLWISGRVPHVISTVDGPVPPIPIEHAAERVDTVNRAAAVGVGPPGRQVVVAVVEIEAPGRSPLAGITLASSIRAEISAATGREPAAVLVTPHVPVDKRHNSKVDRARVDRWADRVLAGERPGRI